MVVVYWVMWMSAVCMLYVAFSIVDSTIILRYIMYLKDQFQTIDFVCDHAKQFFSRNACPKLKGHGSENTRDPLVDCAASAHLTQTKCPDCPLVLPSSSCHACIHDPPGT